MPQKVLSRRERLYSKAFKARGREEVVLWDVLPVRNGEEIRIVFESAASAWRQGIWLRTDQGLRINGMVCPSAELWADAAPSEVMCECRTEDGFLSVYNIWDSGRGYGTKAQAWGSGMLVEELPLGRRFRCNDIGLETNFDKLVFRIERVSGLT